MINQSMIFSTNTKNVVNHSKPQSFNLVNENKRNARKSINSIQMTRHSQHTETHNNDTQEFYVQNNISITKTKLSISLSLSHTHILILTHSDTPRTKKEKKDESQRITHNIH